MTDQEQQEPELVYGRWEVDEDGYLVCSNPRGHGWTYTGMAYGGDDSRWHGEGRCFCIYCGADDSAQD